MVSQFNILFSRVTDFHLMKRTVRAVKNISDVFYLFTGHVRPSYGKPSAVQKGPDVLMVTENRPLDGRTSFAWIGLT